MNVGIPIFIDWKHVPFKYDEIILWNERIELTNDFYDNQNLIDKIRTLKKIQEIEKISHILIDKKKINIDCKNFIDDKRYLLLRVDDCFID